MHRVNTYTINHYKHNGIDCLEASSEPYEPPAEMDCIECKDDMFKGDTYIEVNGDIECLSCVEDSYHHDTTDSFLSFIGYTGGLKELLDRLDIEIYTVGEVYD